jgi:protocatechuate 3,4-dioxygenase beta subunit
VVLNEGQKGAKATSADIDGRYEFTELAAGRYSITASKPMYAACQYGQRSARDAARPVVIADGEVLEKIDVALPKGGVIAGRIFDDLGEPADYIRIAAMRLQYSDGRRQLVPLAVSYVRTNDLGEYRIYGLPPGRYYVGIAPPVADSVPRPRAGRSFGASYFPGASNIAEARPIDLDAGQERLDADFALVVSRPLKATGVVVDRLGRAVPGGSVYAMQPMGRGGFFIAARGEVQPNGAFAIENLAPGSYTLSIERRNAAADTDDAASEPLVVGGADVEGIVLTMAPTTRVTGRVRTEARTDALPSMKDVSIYAEQRPGSTVAENRSTWVADEGTFALSHIGMGPVRLTLTGLPTGWALKSVWYGGKDVTDALNVREDTSGVELIVTTRVSVITGIVTDTENRALDEYTVVVCADDQSRWDNPRFLATARPDQNGRFSVRGLPPGTYIAVAVHEVEAGEASDPEYLERMRPNATKIAIGDGETKSLDLKVVKPGRP